MGLREELFSTSQTWQYGQGNPLSNVLGCAGIGTLPGYDLRHKGDITVAQTREGAHWSMHLSLNTS